MESPVLTRAAHATRVAACQTPAVARAVTMYSGAAAAATHLVQDSKSGRGGARRGHGGHEVSPWLVLHLAQVEGVGARREPAAACVALPAVPASSSHPAPGGCEE
jgi:hypothetical protein